MFAQSRLAELEINSCEDFAMFHCADVFSECFICITFHILELL